MLHKLEVSVHAHWNDNPPVYRLYVDNEMLTERTFSHTPYQFFVIEHIFCNLPTGVHNLTLENLDREARFELDNFQMDGIKVNTNLMKSNGSKIEWRFVVDNLLNNQTVKIDYAKISNPTPLSPPMERPKKVVVPKNYDTYMPMIQRSRQLNLKK